MKCVKCGKELTEGAKFCKSCGTPAETSKEAAKQNKEELKTKETAKQEEKKPDQKQSEDKKADVKKPEEKKPEEKKPENQDLNQKSTTEPKITEAKVSEQTSKVKIPMDPKKVRLIAGVAAGVVVVGIAGTLLWGNVAKPAIAFGKYKKALEEDDYKEAKKIVKESIRGTKKEDKAVELLEAEIDELFFSYQGGSYKLDELKEEIDEVRKIKLDIKDKLDETDEKLKALEKSQNNYESAESNFDYGAYENAIEQYKLVMEEDPNYEKAQKKIKECTQKEAGKMIENMNECLEDDNVYSAIEYLVKLKQYAEANPELQDQYDTEEKDVVQKAVNYYTEHVEEEIDDEEYGRAVNYVNTFEEIVGKLEGNKELEDAYTKLAGTVVDSVYNYYCVDGYETYMKNNGYGAPNLSYLYENMKKHEALIKPLEEKIAELLKTKEAELKKSLASKPMKEVEKEYHGLLHLAATSEDYDTYEETYADYFELEELVDMSKEYDYKTCDYDYGWRVKWNGDTTFDDVAYLCVDANVDRDKSFFSVALNGERSLSGYLVNFSEEGVTGKLTIACDGKTLFEKAVDGKTGKTMIHVEIPEGAKKLTFTSTKDAAYKDKQLKPGLCDVYLGDAYYKEEAAE